MLNKIEDTINLVMDYVGYIAASTLILLVVVIAFNVSNRYFFNFSGIGIGAEELAWHLYSICFLLGIPYALRTSSHVRVDLIFEKLSPQKKAVIDLTGTCIFLIPLCLIVIRSGWNFTLDAWNLGSIPDSLGAKLYQIITTGIGEKSQDPGGLLNRWFIKGIIPLSFFLLLLASISFILRKINILLGLNQNDDEVKHTDNKHGQAFIDTAKNKGEQK